ncbi:MAG: S8 family serine peptidase [bacterium]
MRSIAVVLLLCGLCLPPSPALASNIALPNPTETPPRSGGPVPGKLLVKIAPDSAGAAAADAVASRLGGKIERFVARGRYALIKVPEDHWIPSIARSAKQFEGILSAAPVYRRRIANTIPTDPDFSNRQWNLNNTGQLITFSSSTESGTPDADIDAPEAWDLTTGTVTVVVAVIDTGIATSNGELSSNLWYNSGEIPGNSLDDDSNGHVDDINGWNFYSDTSNVEDDYGHGTFVSGIIGARGNNGVGLAGINWRVSLMTLKTFNSAGLTDDSYLLDAIDYAVAKGARVINASWGDWEYSEVMNDAILDAARANVVFVAAAGNESENMEEHPFYPAALALTNGLSVGSSNFLDNWSSFSNWGDTLVDIFAPGENVYSTRQTFNTFGSGTSYATPHVSGAVALLLSKEPTLSSTQIRARILGAFDARESLDGRARNSGRLSLYKLLTAHGADLLPPAAITDLSVVSTGCNGFELTFTAPGDDSSVGTAALYDARVRTSSLDAANFFVSPRVYHLPRPSTAGTNEHLFVTELDPDTSYFIRLLAYDDAGNTSTLSNQVVATTAGRTVVFSDDMESGESKWTASGGFARTSEEAHSGNMSWTESPGGEYSSNQTATLTSIPIDLSGVQHPRLRFYHEHLFEDVGATFNDGGEVQISTDGGTMFNTIARFYDGLTPWHPVMLSLSDYAGQSDVRVRFSFHSDGSTEDDGWHIDDVEVFSASAVVPEPSDFVVESRGPFGLATAPLYEETTAGGSWTDSSLKAIDSHLRAVQARYNLITDGLASTARFTPAFSASGRYEVFAIWGGAANSKNVRYLISHVGGSTEVFLNQNGAANANRWVNLGEYEFSEGRSQSQGSVLLDESTVTGEVDTGSEGRVYSDAVRFVYVGSTLATSARAWELYQ